MSATALNTSPNRMATQQAAYSTLPALKEALTALPNTSNYILDICRGDHGFGFSLQLPGAGLPPVVVSVERDGKAERAGMFKGDEIIELNMEPVDKMSQQRLLAILSRSYTINMVVRRTDTDVYSIIDAADIPESLRSKSAELSQLMRQGNNSNSNSSRNSSNPTSPEGKAGNRGGVRSSNNNTTTTTTNSNGKSSSRSDRREHCYYEMKLVQRQPAVLVVLQRPESGEYGLQTRQDGVRMIVSHLTPGGLVSESGSMHVGDEIVSVNGVSVASDYDGAVAEFQKPLVKVELRPSATTSSSGASGSNSSTSGGSSNSSSRVATLDAESVASSRESMAAFTVQASKTGSLQALGGPSDSASRARPPSPRRSSLPAQTSAEAAASAAKGPAPPLPSRKNKPKQRSSEPSHVNSSLLASPSEAQELELERELDGISPSQNPSATASQHPSQHTKVSSIGRPAQHSGGHGDAAENAASSDSPSSPLPPALPARHGGGASAPAGFFKKMLSPSKSARPDSFTVTLTRNPVHGFGLFFEVDGANLVVGQIFPGSPAAASAEISIGDYLLAVNGVLVRAMAADRVLTIIAQSQVVQLSLKRKHPSGQQGARSVRLQKGPVGFGFTTQPANKQLLVTTVIPHSPASQFGMVPGDFILEINGTPAKKLQEKDLLKIFTTCHEILLVVLSQSA